MRAGAKDHFWLFCRYYDWEFFEKRQFLKEIALAFQEVYDEYKKGNAIKVSASMPPRSGKSYITSLFCAWWLGKFPEHSVMRNACTSTLYRKFSYDVRAVIRSGKYREVFPEIEMADDKQNLDGWSLTTSKQVGYFGAGVGGTIIGFGASIAMTDDLYKDMADALSETVQEGVSLWKQSAHNSRMEKNCPEIYIGTRWTMRDEIGKAIDKGEIDIEVMIPAITDEGESFCDDVKSTAEYLKIKHETDEEIWLAEYMQQPAELKGLLFPKSGLKTFKPTDLRGKPEYRFSAVDPADTGGDDTSAPFCDLYGKGVYVTSVIYNNHGTDETIPNLVARIVKQKLNYVEVEGVSAWVLFAKEVRKKVQEKHPDCTVRVLKNTANKQTRILAASAWIRNHVHFLEEEFWDADYRKFMKVLTSYLRSGSSKDDAPDSLAMVYAFFQKTFPHLW